jgi:hypothetical protein
LTSPAAHVSILRNPDFFAVDRLGVNHTFYEIPLQKATVDIVYRARRSYTGYSFTNIDLRDKIKSSGTRDMAAESNVQRPHTPSNDSQPGQADSSCGVTDLRTLITGKKPPPKLELFTDNPYDNTSQGVRQKDKGTVERNSKFNKEEKHWLLKKSLKQYVWENYAPPEQQPGYFYSFPSLHAEIQNHPPASHPPQQPC